MTQEGAGGDHQGNDPNFILPNHDVVREGNWEEYRARGFRPFDPHVENLKSAFGAQYVYTGDAWDTEASRPLRHKPGIGAYVDLAGFEAETGEHVPHWLDDGPAES